MVIYGGHDYYDCGMAYGRDPSIVLLREGKEISYRDVFIPGNSLRMFEGRLEVSAKLRHIRVVFGAKIYHGVEVRDNNYDMQYFWNAAKLREWVASQRNITIELMRPWFQKTKLPLEDYFTATEATNNLRDYMIAHQYAIILQIETEQAEPKVFVNPSDLKRVGFAKALDPYTAYQELMMWVGGVLGGTSPSIVTITDDRTLLEGHGFDHRVSFRGPRLK